MDKEFLKILMEFAKEYNLMHLPVTRVINLYDEYVDYNLDMYIESYYDLNY